MAISKTDYSDRVVYTQGNATFTIYKTIPVRFSLDVTAGLDGVAAVSSWSELASQVEVKDGFMPV